MTILILSILTGQAKTLCTDMQLLTALPSTYINCHPTEFQICVLGARFPSCHPTNGIGIKALKAKALTISALSQKLKV